jgi:hypothetical protein
MRDSGPYTNFNEIYRNIHKKADLFVSRDRLLVDYLHPEVKAVHLPCPALFCATTHRPRSKILKIGFSLQANARDAKVNSVPPDTYAYSIQLLETVADGYDVEIVCHWIEDLICIGKDVGSKYTLRYSYDAKDYLGIYDDYDLIVSTRVHGSAMAASLGIPTITISHSMRTDTVRGFLSQIISVNDSIPSVMNYIQELDVYQASQDVISHKIASLEQYKHHLKSYFPL